MHDQEPATGDEDRMLPVGTGFMQNPEQAIEARFRDLQDLLKEGPEGYRKLLRLLREAIDPSEAELTRARLRNSLQWLTRVGWFLLIGFIAILGADLAGFPSLAISLVFLFSAVVQASAVTLVSFRRLTFAGRFLLPTTVLFIALVWEVIGWDRIWEYGFQIVFVVIVAAAIGWAIDFGASVEPQRDHPLLRRLVLAFTGLILLGTDLALEVPVQSDLVRLAFLCKLLVDVAVVGWAWWPGLRLARATVLDKPDSEILFGLARQRWARFATGRLLAVLIGMFPAYLFLNSVGVQEHLSEASQDTAWVETKESEGAVVWFWTTLGGFLKESDFASLSDQRRLYGFILDSKDEAGMAEVQEIWDLSRDVANHPHDEEIFRNLQDALAKHRVQTVDDFDLIFPSGWSSEDLYKLSAGLFLLEEKTVRRPLLEEGKEARTIYVADDLWSSPRGDGEAHLLVPVRPSGIPKVQRSLYFLQWSAALCLALGLIFLWRRGGDSPLARWVGLALVGEATFFLTFACPFFLPRQLDFLWQRSLDSTGYHFVLTALTALLALSLTVGAVQILAVPAAAVLVRLFRPPRDDRGGRLRRSSVEVMKTVFVVGALLISFIGIALAVLLVSAVEEPAEAEIIPRFFVVTLFVAGSCGLGFLWRRRKIPRPRTGRLVIVVGVLALQGCLWLWLLDEEPLDLPSVATSKLLLFASVAVFAVSMWQIIRHDLLHILVVRDFSFILTFVVLPCFFELSEDTQRDVLETLAATGFLQQSGAEVLAVILAVSLLPRIYRLTTSGLARLSYPQLARLRRSVKACLEILVHKSDEKERRRQLDQIFVPLGISSYQILARASDDQFVRSLSSNVEQLVDTVELSPESRALLASHTGPLDLSRLALEWRYFFVQFELDRLREASGSRYLIPLCLSGSLWGIVLLQDGDRETQAASQPIAEQLGPVGIASLHHRSLPVPEATALPEDLGSDHAGAPP